jgi:hypothetical protein
MYRRPKFLEVLLKIREEMAREADYDVDLFVEMVRTGARLTSDAGYSLAEADDQASQRPLRTQAGRRSKSRSD